mgnify:CR=1 FL=1
MTETTKEYIDRIVAEAPPFTSAQKSKLHMLFSDPGPEPIPVEDDDFDALREVTGNE